ncbi:MAG: hypothetical protein OEL78_03115, partial [Hyphomicrobiales bacterium]|nr:hypothetical protein [Hyphomicrobiales bacterium]
MMSIGMLIGRRRAFISRNRQLPVLPPMLANGLHRRFERLHRHNRACKEQNLTEQSPGANGLA